MSEPITVIPPPYDECEFCGEEADDEVQLLRCSSCKNKFYCSAACQKKGWKSHKMDCSPLPVPLISTVPEPSAEMTAEEVFDSWKNIDEDEASKQLTDMERLKLKVKQPSYKALCNKMLEKSHPLDRALHSFRRLYWIDTVANMKTEQQREEWLSVLKNMRAPASFPQIVPEKTLLRPGELSPGEYEMLGQAASMKTFDPLAREGEQADEQEGKRWLHLAVVYKQTRES
ncbi:hypothetical protein BD626DRAFT_559516 [Schizophyllum amplum]|uniref:MYND-type domain-containing protein n=1 Tax=Schizophyllum amplum TaxID=97359 RepID=A0A550C492_9AGAR|nr:hypothetical protein BD626DRAFT_559516 [Auriculariopsis ampla]